MIQVYDRQGLPTAWRDGNFIYDLHGRQIFIFIESNGVFNYKGKYLGYFSTGFFRDKQGSAVAFVWSAHDGPILPMMYDALPIVHMPPILPGFLARPPLPPFNRADWSRLSWKEFITQGNHKAISKTPINPEAFGLISPEN